MIVTTGKLRNDSAFVLEEVREASTSHSQVRIKITRYGEVTAYINMCLDSVDSLKDIGMSIAEFIRQYEVKAKGEEQVRKIEMDLK